jgi:hypothetical protein
MSDPERFVVRWSRLKRATVEKKSEADAARSSPPPAAETAAGAEQGAEGAPPLADKAPEAGFDPASLPPIESITAYSDVRAFLQSGVPAELTKAALRRVWTTDPAIRDFIGIAENQWDFTDPTAMPGFGPLEAADDVRELVAQAMGKLAQVSEPDLETAGLPVSDTGSPSSSACAPIADRTPPQVPGMPERNEGYANTGGSVENHNKIDYIAPQHADTRAEDGIVPNRRAHGRALPK